MCEAYAIEEVDKVGYADEGKDPCIDLPYDTPFHGLVI